ncbi:MAG: ATP-binding protein [Actinomycetota bacterium]
MQLQISVPLHFAAEFVLLVVTVGAMFEALRTRSAQRNRFAWLQALGFGVLAAAQILHGSRILDADTDRALAVTRALGYALLLFGARPSLVIDARAAPAILVAGGVAPSWFVVPAALAALVAVRGAAVHRTDQDPATFAFAGAFAAFAAAEAATAAGGTHGGNWLIAAHSLRAAAAFLLARWLWTSIVRSIRLRFVAAFIAGLVVLILVISTALTQVIANNVANEELQRVSLSASSEAQALTPIGQRAALASSTVAQNRAVQSLVQAHNKKEMQKFVEDALKSGLFQDLDFLVIVDARGMKLATAASTPGNRSKIAPMPPQQAEAVAGSDLIACVLRLSGCPVGRPVSSGDTVDTAGPDTVVFMAAAAVPRAGGSRPAGALALGYRLDHDFVQSIARRSGSAVSILHGGEIITTTFQPDQARTGLARGVVGRTVRQTVDERGASYATQTHVGGRTYFTAFVPLRRKIDGQTVAVLAVSRAATAAAVTQRGINGILFVVALIAAAIASLIASLVGARITRPIRALTTAAVRVRGGDLHARAEVDSSDEVGALGAAFNQMTGSLDQLTGDLRRAADEEATLREQMEAIMQSMGDGLVATDSDGKVVAFNRAAERIVGHEARKALGKKIGDVLKSATATGPSAAELAMGGGGEVELAREGGGRVPVALTSAPLRDASGRPGGRVVVFRDVSREAEAERMKTEFLSNVSHELRTPLTPIKGYTEILKRKQFPRQKALGFLEGILESTSRLERIVEILVDFAAMEAGRLKARTEPVDLRAFSAELLARWKARDSAHSFVVKVPAAIPAAEADPRLLSKCVDELVDNAVKFSPSSNGRKPKVEIDADVVRHGGRRRVRLSVRDHGIGISPEQMPSIFQDFRQLDGSETRPFGGLGLGLAYARRVVEVHHGDIEVESVPGKGSTFSLLLPVAGKKAPAARKRGPAR